MTPRCRAWGPLKVVSAAHMPNVTSVWIKLSNVQMGRVKGAGMDSYNKIRAKRKEERRGSNRGLRTRNAPWASRPSSASPTRTSSCGLFHARAFFSLFSKGLLMTLNCVILLKSSIFQMYVKPHGFKWFLTWIILASTAGHLCTFLVEKDKYYLL